MARGFTKVVGSLIAEEAYFDFFSFFFLICILDFVSGWRRVVEVTSFSLGRDIPSVKTGI